MIKFRRAFSMMVAIFTILILSIVATYIFYSSASIAKEGEIQYKREQAILLARSYTEYAVMAIMGNSDRSSANKCLTQINAIIGKDENSVDMGLGYKIRVVITYIGNQKYIQNCSRIAASLQDPPTDPDTLSAIIDVYVSYRDWNNDRLYNGTATQKKDVSWQTYHRRSIQKI
jgi:hypothetical protein